MLNAGVPSARRVAVIVDLDATGPERLNVALTAQQHVMGVVRSINNQEPGKFLFLVEDSLGV